MGFAFEFLDRFYPLPLLLIWLDSSMSTLGSKQNPNPCKSMQMWPLQHVEVTEHLPPGETHVECFIGGEGLQDGFLHRFSFGSIWEFCVSSTSNRGGRHHGGYLQWFPFVSIGLFCVLSTSSNRYFP